MDYSSSRASFQDGPFHLPTIQGGYGSTPPIGESQLMPYGRRTSQLSTSLGNMPPYDHSDGANMKGFEQRLTVAEQSNRALLDMVAKLQGELKQANKRTDDGLAVERRARQDLTENVRTTNDLLGQIGTRLKRSEDKVQDGKSAFDALVKHTRQVEKGIVNSHQEIVSRRDKQLAKIVELRSDLDEANRARDQLERTTSTLVDEIRTLKSTVDNQQMEFNGVLHELKERAKRLEEDNRQAMYESKKINDKRNIVEQEMAQLRVQMNMRVGEIRDALIDLRNRMQQEESDRRRNESHAGMKMNDLQSLIHNEGRKRDEAIHAIDAKHRDREHAADNERLKLQGKLAETAEELTKNILNKEIKLREEMQHKFAGLEKFMRDEQTARAAHEQTMREDNDKRWNSMQRLTYDEILNLRASHKTDYKKLVDGLNKVTEAIGIVEKQHDETKKQHERVMREERQSRELQDKRIRQMTGKTEGVQESLSVAISSLQEAIGGISEKVDKASLLADEKQKSTLNEINRTGLRGLADVDAKLMILGTKVDKQEDLIEAKIAEGLKTQGDSNADKFSDVTEWKESTDSTLRELKEKVDSIESKGHRDQQQTDSLDGETEIGGDRINRIEEDLDDLTARLDKIEPKVSDLDNTDDGMKGLKDDVDSLMDFKESAKDNQTKFDKLDKDIEEIKKDIEQLKDQKMADDDNPDDKMSDKGADNQSRSRDFEKESHDSDSFKDDNAADDTKSKREDDNDDRPKSGEGPSNTPQQDENKNGGDKKDDKQDDKSKTDDKKSDDFNDVNDNGGGNEPSRP